MAPSNEMAAENIPPEAVGTGIGAIVVGVLLVVKRFFSGLPPELPEKREDLRRENDKINDIIVKNLGAAIDNLAHIIQIHNTHQQEFRDDFKTQMMDFKTEIRTQIREFKDEVRDDIRELRGLK
jgi:hypothetical protein